MNINTWDIPVRQLSDFDLMTRIEMFERWQSHEQTNNASDAAYLDQLHAERERRGL